MQLRLQKLTTNGMLVVILLFVLTCTVVSWLTCRPENVLNTAWKSLTHNVSGTLTRLDARLHPHKYDVYPGTAYHM